MEELILDIIPKFLIFTGVMFILAMIAIAAGYWYMRRE